jgi:hypothetical protein
MTNASYIRFECTYPDLVDCYKALYNKRFDELGSNEIIYAKKLIELCGKISNEFDYLITD